MAKGVLAFSFLTVVAVFSYGAQESQKQPDLRDSPVIKVSAELVNFPVTVSGRKGLGKGNFMVAETISGQREFKVQVIEWAEPTDRLPLRGGIVIDTSGSTAWPGQFRDQKTIAANLVEFIFRSLLKENRGDRIFMAEFNYENHHARTGDSVLQMRTGWSSDQQELTKALLDLKPGGFTPLLGSIEQSSRKFLEEAGGNFSTFLIVISDGYEQRPETYQPNGMALRKAFSDFRSAIASAQLAHLSVYTIGTFNRVQAANNKEGFKRANKNLADIAGLTGGRFYYYPELTKIPAIVAQIKNDLENRYYISYKPDPNYKNGEDIKIRVEAGEYDEYGRWKRWPNVKLLHREGYKVIKD